MFHHSNTEQSKGVSASLKMASEGNTMDNKLYNAKASSQAVAHDITKARHTFESAPPNYSTTF